jgi:hypothetical protein
MTQFVELLGEIAIVKVFGAGALVSLILGFVVGLWAAILGGYVADAMRQGAAVLLAVIAFSIVAAMMLTMSDKPPLWYQIGFLIFAPAAALSGGALARHRIVY